jgi:hypothetical protein
MTIPAKGDIYSVLQGKACMQISCSQGGKYEDDSLLGYCAV